MRQSFFVVGTVAAALIAGVIIGESTGPVRGQAANVGFGAVTGYKGGLDVLSGPYEVVPNWPKPLSQLPGHENWTWGAVQGVFAESPDRVFMLERGELPAMQRPQPKAFPEVGPSLSFPSDRRRAETPRREWSRALLARAARALIPMIPSRHGKDGWASTRAGNTPSSCSIPPATSSSSGPSGTR
jgi:hypothetical protein